MFSWWEDINCFSHVSQVLPEYSSPGLDSPQNLHGCDWSVPEYNNYLKYNELTDGFKDNWQEFFCWPLQSGLSGVALVVSSVLFVLSLFVPPFSFRSSGRLHFLIVTFPIYPHLYYFSCLHSYIFFWESFSYALVSKHHNYVINDIVRIFCSINSANSIGSFDWVPDSTMKNIHCITKTRLFKYIESLISKNWKFSDKKLKFFIYLLKT